MKRIYLRALEPEDYKQSIKWRNDDEIWRGVVGPKYFVSSSYEKKWVENATLDTNKNLKLAICLHESNKYIGNVYLSNIDWQNRNAAFAILIGDKEQWGKGLGQEAVFKMLQHAFLVLGLERVYIRCLLTNLSSINMHKKCGFKEEGRLRNAIFKEGKYQDLQMMSIIREDYDELVRKKYEQ